MYKYKNYIQRNIRWKFILYGKYPYIEGIFLVAWETDDRDFVYDGIIIILIDLYMCGANLKSWHSILCIL